jgi:adenylate cyclase
MRAAVSRALTALKNGVERVIAVPRDRVMALVKGRPRIVGGIVAALVSAFLVFAPLSGGRLPFHDIWDAVEAVGFDRLTIATAPNANQLPLAIIGIDDESISKIGKQWPWPRSMHAELIDRLTKAGAAVIAFDVIFDTESADPAQDQALAAAIKNSGRVILVADKQVQQDAGITAYTIAEPLPAFQSAGAAVGLANVEFEHDFAVRRFNLDDRALWREIIRRAARTVPEIGSVPNPGDRSFIRHLGPPRTFQYVPYYLVLTASEKDLADAFNQKIVLIGRNLRASVDVNMAAADLFFTPFTAKVREPTPGVELHATMVENAITRDWITPVSRFITWLVALGCIAICALSMKPWHPFKSALPLAICVVATVSTAYALFRFADIWLPFMLAIAMAGFIYLWMGGYYFLVERKERMFLFRAFSDYVSPEVASMIAARPELIRLGGERRTVTLMFTDLAGFTKMSEKLPPERVSAVLNRHFTEMVSIIRAPDSHGTVDKFIGDAIMAFWGAPLPDDEHALHALTAAMRMQAAMQVLREELLQEGLPPVHMRLGLNSGDAVIGNMGSETKKQYTAIGDNVNLAARLEGINKLYGTYIIASESTARAVGDRVRLRKLDKVMVSGKSEPVVIYTPHYGHAFEDVSERALALYFERNWEASEGLWNEVLTLDPGNKTATVFLERIGELRAASLPENWDGSVALEKF